MAVLVWLVEGRGVLMPATADSDGLNSRRRIQGSELDGYVLQGSMVDGDNSF